MVKVPTTETKKALEAKKAPRGNTGKNALRIPPQSLESEKAVLGSIMLRKDAMHEVEDVVSPDSFYAEKHKKIFQAMLDLSAKNEPIDMLSLSTKLSEQKVLESIGGNRYLAEIVNGDFKEFLMGEKKVGIGQVELPELSEVQQKKQELQLL